MKRFAFIATTLVTSTLSLSLVGGISQAQASSLVPIKEGEIKLSNIGCVTGSCIDTTPYGYTVSSETYNINYLPSLLFSDDSGTPNDYSTFGISFANPDAGTNTIAGQNWFRPVAIKSDGSFPEAGQLEVGQYTFNFAKTIAQLQLSFFDVEDTGTSILAVNGNPYGAIYPGENANIQTVTLTNVDSFKLKLGNIGGKFTTGDGVRLSASQSVPEPETNVSFAVLAVAVLFGLQKYKRKKASQAG